MGRPRHPIAILWPQRDQRRGPIIRPAYTRERADRPIITSSATIVWGRGPIIHPAHAIVRRDRPIDPLTAPFVFGHCPIIHHAHTMVRLGRSIIGSKATIDPTGGTIVYVAQVIGYLGRPFMPCASSLRRAAHAGMQHTGAMVPYGRRFRLPVHALY